VVPVLLSASTASLQGLGATQGPRLGPGLLAGLHLLHGPQGNPTLACGGLLAH
jgi:hypothetical protein